jgi:hypothetical protein
VDPTLQVEVFVGFLIAMVLEEEKEMLRRMMLGLLAVAAFGTATIGTQTADAHFRVRGPVRVVAPRTVVRLGPVRVVAPRTVYQPVYRAPVVYRPPVPVGYGYRPYGYGYGGYAPTYAHHPYYGW